MSNSKEFPKLDGGWCDGLGCGKGICWCGERLAMREEFQRTYNKPWKHSFDENPDVDCDRVDHMCRFSTRRISNYHDKAMQEMQADIDRLKRKLETTFIMYQKETDGDIIVKRCESLENVNTFIRENDLCVDDCKVVSGGYLLSRNERSKMWFYKRALQK